MQSMNQQQDSMEMHDSSGSYHQHKYLLRPVQNIVNPLYHSPQPVANYAMSPGQQQQYNVSPTQGWGNGYPVAPVQETSTSKNRNDSRLHSEKAFHTLIFDEEFDIPAINSEQQPNMQPMKQQQDNMNNTVNTLYHDPQPLANYAMSPGQQQEMKMEAEQLLSEIMEQYNMSPIQGWGNGYPAAAEQEPTAKAFHTLIFNEEFDIPAINSEQQPNMQPMNQQQDNMNNTVNTLYHDPQPLANYAMSPGQQQEMKMEAEQLLSEIMEQYNMSPIQGWGNGYPAAAEQEPTAKAFHTLIFNEEFDIPAINSEQQPNMQPMNQQQDNMNNTVNTLYHDPQPLANYAMSPGQQQEMNMEAEQLLSEIMEQYNMSPIQGWGNGYPAAAEQEPTAKAFHTLIFDEEFDITAINSEQQPNMQPMNQHQDNMNNTVNTLYHDPQPLANYAMSPGQQQEMKMEAEQLLSEIMEQYNMSPIQGWGNGYPAAAEQEPTAKAFHTLIFDEEFDITAINSEQQPNMQPMNQQQDNMNNTVNTLHPDPQPLANYAMSPGQQQEMKMEAEQLLSEIMEQYNMSPIQGWGNGYPAAAEQEPTAKLFYTPCLGEEPDISGIISEEQPNMQPMNQQQDNMDMNPLGLDFDIVNFLYGGPQPLPNYAKSSGQQQDMMMNHEQPPPESMEQYNMSPVQGWGNSYPAVTGQEPSTSKSSYDTTPHSAKLTAMKQPSPEPADQEVTDIQAKSKAERKRKRSKTPYQIFFGDTCAAIKRHNPKVRFGEVSKIVSAMWNSLDSEHKNVYKNIVLNSEGGGENEGMGDMNGQQQQLGVLQSPMRAVPNHMNMTQHNNSYMQQLFECFPFRGAARRSASWAIPAQPNCSIVGRFREARVFQQLQRPRPNIAQPSEGPMTAAPSRYLYQEDGIAYNCEVPSQQQVPQNVQHMQHMSPHSTVSSSPPVSSAGPIASAVRLSSAQQNAGQGAVHLSKCCVRDGCPNPAIWDDQWEDEYCSNECAMSNCRKVYLAWLTK